MLQTLLRKHEEPGLRGVLRTHVVHVPATSASPGDLVKVWGDAVSHTVNMNEPKKYLSPHHLLTI